MNIVVLAGGTSTERDISIMTSVKVCESLRRNGHNANIIDVFFGIEDKAAETFFDDNGSDLEKIAADMKKKDILVDDELADRKKSGKGFFGDNVLALCLKADIVFMGLHGSNGEDGKIQAVFELLEMKKRFGDERRTEIQSVTGEVDIEDLIAEEQCVYTLTEAGYIKRQLKATYQAQRRGGRGISGMTRKEEDIVQEMFVGSTHDYVLFVTDRGRLFRIKGYTIAEGSRTSKGMNIVNLLQLAEGEKVTNMICQSKDAEQSGGYVTMVTKQGLIKRTPLEQYANIRKSGLIGIALNEGDALAWTRLTSGHDMLIVATRNGQAIRFNEEDARPMGRNGHGVRAIRLAEGDEVVGVCICREGGTVLTVTENGKGRRSDIDTYRITARGGKGIRNYDVSRDKVAAVKIVDDVDDVLLSSQEGIIIRLHANEIPLQSRYGSGVRVMRLGENDKVMVLARTDHDDEAQTEKIDASEAEAEPTAEQLAEMEAADAAAATEAPEADPEEKE